MLGSALSLFASWQGCTTDVCQQAAELCGASQSFDSGQCQGAPRAYAQCIVDRGDCSPKTLVECAADDVNDPYGSVGRQPPATSEVGIHLTILSWRHQPPYFDVGFEITNVSEAIPVTIAPALFFVEDASGHQYAPSGGICQGAAALTAGGSERCELQYRVPDGFWPAHMVYRDERLRQASADFTVDPGCTTGLENSLAACSDGCDNDGDKFVDCDDYDCCAVRPDCPASSACGKRRPQQQCIPGPENSLAACSDGCDNDGDKFVDCDDYDCCAVRPDCPASSACGSR